MHAVDAHVSGVRWAGEFTVETPGTWQWTFEAWTDRWATWHDELRRKVDADLDEDLYGELSEGVVLPQARAREGQGRREGLDRVRRSASSDVRRRRSTQKFDVALGPELFHAMEEAQEREGATTLEKPIIDRGRPRQGALLRLVRAVPALLGRPEGRRGAASRRSPTSASTSSTCCRSTRSASRTARAATTRSPPARTIPARRTRSAAPRAATSPSTPSSAPSRTSATCAPPRTSTAWTSRSTSRSTRPPTTRG